MRLKAITTVAAIGLVIGLAACGSTKPAEDVAPRRQANAFLDAAESSQLSELCALFTEEFLMRMAPPDGACPDAMRNLTRFTGGGSEDTLSAKKVGEVKVTGDVAIVTLEDRVTQENPLPLRMIRQGEGDDEVWLIDEIGDGAKLSEACLAEQEAVEEAVDSFLSNNDNVPRNAQELVPSFLPKLPDNHEVDEDGNVIPTGVCA